uniref:Rab-GAP TBC domain-containing protein n=1 Tax=Compsopogon caeruleus TaxID=31354 RepID=A0A7S1TFB6_9RHOD|mmetsp:Transcript_4697/g.9483  ORF Transcript_4697/g.9483 Transcript_4697/m.9483 type:complete len:429 (+) Transcript_4697:748-2034(+)
MFKVATSMGAPYDNHTLGKASRDIVLDRTTGKVLFMAWVEDQKLSQGQLTILQEFLQESGELRSPTLSITQRDSVHSLSLTEILTIRLHDSATMTITCRGGLMWSPIHFMEAFDCEHCIGVITRYMDFCEVEHDKRLFYIRSSRKCALVSSTSCDVSGVPSTKVPLPAFFLQAHRHSKARELERLAKGAAFSLVAWSACRDETGRIIDPSSVSLAIFDGGVAPEARCHIWPFLLGVFSVDSTSQDRAKQRDELVLQYARLKQKWQKIAASVDGELDDRIMGEQTFLARASMIRKDVQRTDRDIGSFQSDFSPMLRKMNSILMTFAFVDPELGYCQGMSDFLSPIIGYLNGDEAMSFWCFRGLMGRVGSNFRNDQRGILDQLREIQSILEETDPELANHIRKCDPQLHTCFRWIIVQFKRELSFENVAR